MGAFMIWRSVFPKIKDLEKEIAARLAQNMYISGKRKVKAMLPYHPNTNIDWENPAFQHFVVRRDGSYS